MFVVGAAMRMTRASTVVMRVMHMIHHQARRFQIDMPCGRAPRDGEQDGEECASARHQAGEGWTCACAARPVSGTPSKRIQGRGPRVTTKPDRTRDRAVDPQSSFRISLLEMAARAGIEPMIRFLEACAAAISSETAKTAEAQLRTGTLSGNCTAPRIGIGHFDPKRPLSKPRPYCHLAHVARLFLSHGGNFWEGAAVQARADFGPKRSAGGRINRVTLAGHDVLFPVARDQNPAIARPRLHQNRAAELADEFGLVAMLEDSTLEGREDWHAAFLAESLSRKRQRQERVAHEHAAAGDEIERRAKLEKKEVARLQRLEVNLAARSPEVHLVRLPLRKEAEPVVVGDSNEQFHAGRRQRNNATPGGRVNFRNMFAA